MARGGGRAGDCRTYYNDLFRYCGQYKSECSISKLTLLATTVLIDYSPPHTVNMNEGWGGV